MTGIMSKLGVDAPSPPHSKSFWLNFVFLCLVLGLAEAARGIVLPTLSLYVSSLGGSGMFLSIVVSAFSVGRLISSLIFGVVSDHYSMLFIILSSLVITISGHIFFIIAGSISGGLYLLLFSRLFTGFGTGILSVARAFVSKRTAPIERTKFMAKLGIVQFMGYAFTPILGGITVNLGSINTYNAGTYALVVLDSLLFVALYFSLRHDQESLHQCQTPAANMSSITVLTQPPAETIIHIPSGRQHKGYDRLDEDLPEVSTIEMEVITINGIDDMNIKDIDTDKDQTKASKNEQLHQPPYDSHKSVDNNNEEQKQSAPSTPSLSSTSSKSTRRRSEKRKLSFAPLPTSSSPSSSSRISKSHISTPSSLRALSQPSSPSSTTARRYQYSQFDVSSINIKTEEQKNIDPPSLNNNNNNNEDQTVIHILQQEPRSPLLQQTITTIMSDDESSSAMSPISDEMILIPPPPSSQPLRSQSEFPISDRKKLHYYGDTADHRQYPYLAKPTDHIRRASAPAAFDCAPIIPRHRLLTVNIPSSTPSAIVPLSLRDVIIPPPLSLAPVSLLTPICFVILNLTTRGCLAVAETYGSVLYYTIEYGKNYNPATVDPVGAAWFYTALGAIGVVVFFMMDWFTHYLSELTLLCVGFLAMTIGFITAIDYDNDLKMIGLAFSMSMIYCVATPLTQTLVSSMLSKSLNKTQQGKWMGLLTAAGSVGRIVFPLLSGILYSFYNVSMGLLLPATIAMVAVLGIFLGWKLYRPWLDYWSGVKVRFVEWIKQRREAGYIISQQQQQEEAADESNDHHQRDNNNDNDSEDLNLDNNDQDDDDDINRPSSPWLTIEEVIAQRQQQHSRYDQVEEQQLQH